MKQKLILIGASTGGPGHLKQILCSLGSTFQTPIIIAQHMNKSFIQSFVKQFDSELPNKVSLIDSTCEIQLANIYICAKHCELKHTPLNGIKIESADNVVSHYNPSVEHLFESARYIAKEVDILAILLTGIGADGAKALANLQTDGVQCLAESESSAIVFGMPKRALELNPDIKALDLSAIIKRIHVFEDE